MPELDCRLMRMIVSRGHASWRTPRSDQRVMPPALGEQLPQLIERHRRHGIARVHVDDQGVVAGDVLHRRRRRARHASPRRSAAFIGRLLLAICTVPSINAAMPTPEPPPATSTDTSGATFA